MSQLRCGALPAPIRPVPLPSRLGWLASSLLLALVSAACADNGPIDVNQACTGSACPQDAASDPDSAGDSTTGDTGLTTDTGGRDAVDDRGLDLTPLDVADSARPDADADPLLPFGELCFEDSECESDLCIETTEGGLCTRLCSDTCPEGFECRLVSNFGADIVRVCVPPRDLLCTPCERDRQCGPGNFCLAQDNGDFCAQDCSVSRTCPANYGCNPVTIVGAGPGGTDLDTFQCEPLVGQCLDCIDELNTADHCGACDTPCYPDLNETAECTSAGECERGCIPDTYDFDPLVAGCETECTRNEDTGGSEVCNFRDDDCNGTVDDGFDVQNDPDYCGDCTPCDLGATDTHECVRGACRPLTCDAGFGNCNADQPGGVADGCETDLHADATCGSSCATAVSCGDLLHVAEAYCDGGTCVIERCEGAWVDCDRDPRNGCEINFDDPGTCGSTCATAVNCALRPHVEAASCVEGGCVIDACEDGWDDCGGGAEDGCETDLGASATCGTGCGDLFNCGTLPNVDVTACDAGGCVIVSCDTGWADCDAGTPGGVLNGCEVNLNAPATCGSSCGDAINCGGLANIAAATCEAGACLVVECADGYGNCNAATPGGHLDGCEVNLNDPASCGASCASRRVCADLPNVDSGSCADGICGGFTCDLGFADCSAEPGCETDLGAPATCGSTCGDAVNCGALANVAEASCDDASCEIIRCADDYLDCDLDPANGCEVDLGAAVTCGTTCDDLVDCTDLLNVASATCEDGVCEILSCDGLWRDCNPGSEAGVLDGCELNLASPGSCGTRCADAVMCTEVLPNVDVATCGGGACGVLLCDDHFGDCTSAPGCETNLYSPSSCGDTCGDRVNCTTLPNTTSHACTSLGDCRFSCVSGYDDCTSAAGCETPLTTATSCGTDCDDRVNCTTLPHTNSESCSAGSCSFSCDNGWGNCNSGAGCETNLNATATCGTTCGNATNCASLPNVASAGCSTGSCVISSCNSGYADCSDLSSGCERLLNDNFGSCASAIDIGNLDGDSITGTTLSRTSYGEIWYRFTLQEGWEADCDMSARIQLDVPNDVDYDLYVHQGGSCNSGIVSGTRRGVGLDETVNIGWSDSWLSDDDREIYVEVRFVSGNTLGCGEWNLTVSGYTDADCFLGCDGFPSCL